MKPARLLVQTTGDSVPSLSVRMTATTMEYALMGSVSATWATRVQTAEQGPVLLVSAAMEGAAI